MHVGWTDRTEGVFVDEGGRTAIRFERRYAHPVERVWAALTEPEQLAAWFFPFTAEIELDLVPGGRFDLRWTDPEPGSMSLTVLRVAPPRLFEHTAADVGSFLWELKPDGDATRLVVTNVVPSRAHAAENHFAAGLHTSLDALAALLDGEPTGWSWPLFDDHRDRYAARDA